jgi:hypothetical protein
MGQKEIGALLCHVRVVEQKNVAISTPLQLGLVIRTQTSPAPQRDLSQGEEA